MRTTSISLLAALALTIPAGAAAQALAHPESRVLSRKTVVVQQPPPTPPRPRPAPRAPVHRRDADERAEQRETFTRTVRIGGDGAIDVSNLSGNIEVRRGGGSEATIEATKIARARTDEEARALLPLVTVDVTSRGERAEIKTNYHRMEAAGRRRNVNVTVHYIITAPQNTRVRAVTLSGNIRATDIRGELSLTTTSGNVHIANASRVTAAKSTSGNVELTNIDSDVALEAGTLSGDVILRQVKARRVQAGCVSGRIIVHDVRTERLDAQTISGDVDFSGPLVRAGRYELKSHSGDVRVAVDGGSGFELDANTFSGHVETAFAIGGAEERNVRGRRKTVRGVVGDGSAVLNITTFSGNVHVVKR